MGRSAFRVVLFVMTLALVPALGLVTPVVSEAGTEPTREEMVDLYNRVREAITKVDLAAFEQLVIPAKPDAKKLTEKDLEEAKEMLELILPDLTKVKFHKFAANAKDALFVIQVDPDSPELVDLNVFRFRKKDGKWMLWAKFAGHSFSKENPQADQEQIQKTLENKASFNLPAEAGEDTVSDQVKAALAEPGKTGSGTLTVAGKVYNFKHGFAFRKKALGYEDRINIHVVLTEVPVPVAQIQAQLREKDDWSDFVNNLVLIFDPDLKPDFIHFWVRHESTNFSGPPFQAKGRAALEGERIKGGLKMEKPKKLFGDSFIYDVSFDAPIIGK